MGRKTSVPTKSQTRQAAPDIDEAELLAEIERLRGEVARLSRQLHEERLDRVVQHDVNTVLSTLVNPDGKGAGAGRQLEDGRFIPSAVSVAGAVRPAEPGAPRVPVPGECEFAPGDESATAFDVFFNAPDPHLEKIRRFLLG